MKTGYITIAGRPNVGKSTLLNALVGEKIAIVSNKPQTTRNRITGIYNAQDVQLVFVDTPGIHAPKNKLGEYMLRQAGEAFEDIDCALLVVEPRPAGKTEKELLERFRAKSLPVILIINKVDICKKERVAEAIADYAQTYPFASIVPVSALKNDNVSVILDEILKIVKDGGTVYYPDDIATDQTVRQMAAEIIREKLLRNLSEEVPHGTAVEIVSFLEREDKPLTEISADIICEKDSHKGIIIGKQGQTLKNIATQARQDLEGLLQTKVFLQCFVKIRKDWRNDEKLIEEYEQET